MNKATSYSNYNVRFNDLSKNNFFQDLLEKCYKEKILDNAEIDFINFGTSKILEKQLEYYTRNKSSSIRIDIAENVLKSIYYTLSISLKKSHDINEVIERIKTDSIKSIFKDGQKEIKSKLRKSELLLKYVKNNMLNINNYSYIDTIEYGIDVFFKKYNYYFEAHEVPGDIDYQLSENVFEYTGVEQIERYLKHLYYENQFCKYFDIKLIKSLLYSYSDKSEEMLLNVFDIVLSNSLGSFIASCDINKLNISEFQKKIIKNKVTQYIKDDNTNVILDMYINEIINKFSIDDEKFILYIKKALKKNLREIEYALNTDIIDKRFITFKNDDKNNTLYEPVPKLSDKIFKELFEEIIISDKTEDKIKIFKENIKNPEDMIDMLSSDCFYQYEYNAIFTSLDLISIALITSYIPEIYDDDLKNELWHKEFRNYLKGLSEGKCEMIKSIAHKLEVK